MRQWISQHWFRLWLVAYSAPSHYLNQCWLIVSWTPMNKFLPNFNQNTKLFIHENAFEMYIYMIALVRQKMVPCDDAIMWYRSVWFSVSFQWIDTSLSAIIPFIIILAANCSIIISVNRQKRKMNRLSSTRRPGKESTEKEKVWRYQGLSGSYQGCPLITEMS